MKRLAIIGALMLFALPQAAEAKRARGGGPAPDKPSPAAAPGPAKAGATAQPTTRRTTVIGVSGGANAQPSDNQRFAAPTQPLDQPRPVTVMKASAASEPSRGAPVPVMGQPAAVTGPIPGFQIVR